MLFLFIGGSTSDGEDEESSEPIERERGAGIASSSAPHSYDTKRNTLLNESAQVRILTHTLIDE